MKKGILIFSLLSLFSFSTLTADTIRITNGEWEPFHSEYVPHYGVNSHIVSEAFKLEGIKVKWGFFPWARSYKVAKEGIKWDASATWWVSKEAKADFLISDPVGKTSFVFFHLKNKPFDWKSINDLKGLKIGGTSEYNYGEDFMIAMRNKTIKVQIVSKDETNFKKLIKGRIDIFPNDPIVGMAQIRNLLPASQANKVTFHPKEFQVSSLRLLISKKSKQGRYFLKKFNSGLKKLKKSGKVEKILIDLNKGVYTKQIKKWKE